MVRKSYGPRRGTRRKLRVRKVPRIRDFLRKFKIGDHVNIHIHSSVRMPHHKFQGKTGKVLGFRGNAYVVEVRDGNAKKQIITKAVHMRLNG